MYEQQYKGNPMHIPSDARDTDRPKRNLNQAIYD